MLRYLAVACVGLIGACTSENLHVHQEMFDSKSFFETQVKQLESGRYGLSKIMLAGAERDSLFLDSVAWGAELAAFTAIDLRKPAYAGKFLIDSVVQEDEVVIHYKRNDKSTDLEHIWIRKHGNQVDEIKFDFAEQNELYASVKQLIYNPGEGFNISGNQAVRLSTPFSYEVKGVFVPISNQ